MYISDIRKEGKLLNTNFQDLRLSTQKNQTLAITLENPDNLVIYNYQVKVQRLCNCTIYTCTFQNATFTKLLNITVEFQTNLATISIENLTLIVLGDRHRVKVIELDLQKAFWKVIHTIRVSNPRHVVLW